MGLSAPTAVAPYQNLHRLPRGDDGKIGAEYAMATAAAGAAAFYFVVQFVGALLLSVTVGTGSSGPFVGFAAVAAPFGAVTVAGVVAWRSVPPSIPRTAGSNRSIS